MGQLVPFLPASVKLYFEKDQNETNKNRLRWTFFIISMPLRFLRHWIFVFDLTRIENNPSTRYNEHLTKITKNFLFVVLESECMDSSWFYLLFSQLAVLYHLTYLREMDFILFFSKFNVNLLTNPPRGKRESMVRLS